MGMHPSTEYQLVGSEYGNFELPKIKTSLSDLEWLALNNRPELREHDLGNNPQDLRLIIQEFQQPTEAEYKSDPERYNRMWSKQAKEIGYSVYEDANNPNVKDLAVLRRQRMSSLILSQLHRSSIVYNVCCRGLVFASVDGAAMTSPSSLSRSTTLSAIRSTSRS